MHKRVDDFFQGIWNELDFDTPFFIEHAVSRLEWLTHRVVNLFEHDDRWV